MGRMHHITALWGILLGAVISCSPPMETVLLTGRTMGTTYHISLVTDAADAREALQARIDQRLERINQSMSTYRPESEISRFNKRETTDRDFPVSTDFYTVMTAAAQIHRLTGGAWDGTVYPLVKLWGFGSVEDNPTMPSPQAIQKALAKVGFDGVDLSTTGMLKKQRSDLTLDLASIAKGYGVDEVSRLLSELGFANHLVEIGGEIYAAGTRADGKPWKVGINRPEKGAPVNAVYQALTLHNRAMATSGDYRSFVEIDGRTYTHIIDPRTGYPVTNDVVSVSVIAPTCILADDPTRPAPL